MHIIFSNICSPYSDSFLDQDYDSITINYFDDSKDVPDGENILAGLISSRKTQAYYTGAICSLYASM